MKTFCRSVELCDNYLRGFYGLKLTTTELQKALSRSTSNKDTADDDFQRPPIATVQKLDELATSRLAEIIRRYSTSEQGWTGYDEAEIVAARALLEKNTPTIAK